MRGFSSLCEVEGELHQPDVAGEQEGPQRLEGVEKI